MKLEINQGYVLVMFTVAKRFSLCIWLSLLYREKQISF
jgi:hypothetical protein